MNRKPISAKERLRLFTLHNGICHLCGVKIDGARERWDVEHVLALGLGGNNSDGNMRPAHTTRCHKPKTAMDVGMMAKADRMRMKHIGAKPRKPQSKWKRRVDGTVVLR